MELWTQRASVSWPRSLGFFEHRIDILRRFEDSGELHQFNVGDDRVTVRLGDANHTLFYSSAHMELAVLQPTSDSERVKAAAAVVLEALAPSRLLRPSFVFQWISGMTGDYDESRRDAAERLFRGAGPSMTDFAVLVDGKTNEGTVYRLECGIAEAAEFPLRLSRTAGQLAGSSGPYISEEPTLWPREVLPDFGFFCDSIWTPETKLDASVEGFFNLWEDTKVAAEQVVSAFGELLGIGEVSA